MPADLQDVGKFSSPDQDYDYCDIHKTRYHRTDRSAPDSQGRKSQFSENQNIIADTVGHDARDAADQRNLDALDRAQQRRHGGDNDLQRIGKAYDAQILDADSLNLRTVRIQAHDQIRPEDRHESAAQPADHHKAKSKSVRTADSVMVTRTPVLREKQHTAAHKAPVA